MTSDEYLALRDSTFEVFKNLYLVDVASLKPKQRKVHQQALSAAYSAFNALEAKAYAKLSQEALASLDALGAATAKLRSDLAGLKKSTEILAIVSTGLQTLVSIARLLG